MTLEYISANRLLDLEFEKEEASIELRNLNSGTAASLACDSSNAFECNICLEFVQDPVVTFCGHLYCWPCIYKWIHFNCIEDAEQHPQCPVCKAEVSVAAVVPLYGRGKDLVSSEQEAADCGLVIPERPSAPIYWDKSAVSSGQWHLHNHGQTHEPYHPNYSFYDPSSMMSRLGGTNAFQPIIEIFVDMVYSRMFGQSIITNPDDLSDSYNMATAYPPRVRRQLMHADQSLSRLCFFLICCVILCLLLF